MIGPHYGKPSLSRKCLEFDEIGPQALSHEHGIRRFQRRLGRRVFFAAPLVLVAGAALGQGADVKFKRSSLVIDTGGRELKFEVDMATNDAERSHGLMFRKSLGPYEGMLFDFHQEQPVSFWMKNTLIPLDMVFIAADGTIRHIHATPCRCRPTPSPASSRCAGARDQRRQRQAARHQAGRQGQAPDLRQRLSVASALQRAGHAVAHGEQDEVDAFVRLELGVERADRRRVGVACARLATEPRHSTLSISISPPRRTSFRQRS